MKFFPNPEKAAEKKFADTRASRDALAVRLTAAQDAVASAHATLHQLAVEGAVPGPRDGFVLISKAKAPPRERRGFAGAATKDALKASKKAAPSKKK